MKRFLLMLVLVTSAFCQSFAQSVSNIAVPFDVSPDNFKRLFIFDLGDGNKMEIRLTAKEDLDHLANIDSLLRVCVLDLTPLKDSFSDPLVSHRISYLIEDSTLKKIRIERLPPSPGADFLINNNELSALKFSQDTLIITRKMIHDSRAVLFGPRQPYHYYRISFFLNETADLAQYMDGRLNEKIDILRKNLKTEWVSKGGAVRLKQDSSIYSVSSRGYIGGGDLFIMRFSIDAQNYKNYFVPSVTVSGAAVSNNNLVRREFGAGAEFHFLFADDAASKLKRYQNIFVLLSYGRADIDPKATRSRFAAVTLYPYISIGYLAKRSGDFYDKHSMKLGLGRFSLFGGVTRIEPVLYFYDFFKGVTPSLRITQQF